MGFPPSWQDGAGSLKYADLLCRVRGRAESHARSPLSSQREQTGRERASPGLTHGPRGAAQRSPKAPAGLGPRGSESIALGGGVPGGTRAAHGGSRWSGQRPSRARGHTREDDSFLLRLSFSHMDPRRNAVTARITRPVREDTDAQGGRPRSGWALGLVHAWI